MPVDPNDTCWTVLRAASAGDAAARSTFANNYVKPVRAYLSKRWHNTPLAAEMDDAVQDAFFECFKPGGVLEGADPLRGDFRGLLYAVVRNVARRFEEQAAHVMQRRPDQSVYLDDLPHEAAQMSRVFDRAWAQSLLHEAVRHYEHQVENGTPDLRSRFRVLQMRHDQGMPIRTIAEQLGEPDVARVHNDYRRARREFAVHLRKVVATHTGVTGDAVEAECRRVTAMLGT